MWRRACIEGSGGWNSRTTVEDMDLSLRAYIRGWKAIFLQNVTCLNEVSSVWVLGATAWICACLPGFSAPFGGRTSAELSKATRALLKCS